MNSRQSMTRASRLAGLCCGLVVILFCTLAELSELEAQEDGPSSPGESVSPFPQETTAAVALVLEHADRCSGAANMMIDIWSDEASGKEEKKQAVKLYNDTQGVGVYAATRRMSGIVRQLLKASEGTATAEAHSVIRGLLKASEGLCKASEGTGGRMGSGYFLGAGTPGRGLTTTQLETLRKHKARLAVVCPLTGVEKKDALAKYLPEIKEVETEALLEVDPLGARPRSAGEWATADAKYEEWRKDQERLQAQTRQARARQQARLETERLEKQRRVEEAEAAKIAPGIKLSKKKPPSAVSQQYLQEVEERHKVEEHRARVHKWHGDYSEKVAALKNVLRLYLQPMKEGTVPEYTCKALSMRSSMMLNDKQVLSSPEPAINEQLGTALRSFKAAGQSCEARQTDEADAHIAAATQALGRLATELQKFELKP